MIFLADCKTPTVKVCGSQLTCNRKNINIIKSILKKKKYFRRCENGTRKKNRSKHEWKMADHSESDQSKGYPIRKSTDHGPVSISDKTSYGVISQRPEGARSGVKLFVSLYNLTSTLTTVLLKGLSNFRAIGQFKIQIQRLQDFARSYNKTDIA